MNQQTLNALYGVIFALTLCDLAVRLMHRGPCEAWDFYWLPCLVVTAFLIAVNLEILHHWRASGFYLLIACWAAWTWWKNHRNRRRRRKLRDALAGRVADVGGRLRVLLPAWE